MQMPTTIPSAALAQMSDEERARFLDAALKSSPEAVRNYLWVLDARLRVFEARYELPSSELSQALESHRLPDTADVVQWLFWVQVRSHLAGEARA